MIYQLIVSVFLLFYFYAFGLLFQKVLPQINHYFSLTILNGMIGVGLISFVLAFVIPLNFTYEICLIILALFGLIYYKKRSIEFLKFFKKITLYFYLILVCGLVFTVTYPYILDHFGYYVPTIKWLDFAGYVKGLSNLEWVFVQNSFWHILQASINETSDIYYRLNFILFIVFNLYLIESKSIRLLPFNIIFLFFLNIPSPDLPVFVLSVILLNEYLKSEKNVSTYLFFAAIVFVIKPISILLIVFFLIEYFRKKEYKNLKDFNLFLIIGLAILFCLKGIVLAGNPLFPLSFTTLENLSWASPKSMYILSDVNAKFIPLKDLFIREQVQEMNTLTYYKYVLFSSTLRSIILLFILSFTIGLILLQVFKKEKNKTIYYLLFSVLIKVFFVIFTSPQFRFLLDVLIVDTLIILLMLKKEFFSKKWKIFNLALLFVLMIGVITPNIWSKYIKGIRSFSYIRGFETPFFLKPGQYDDLEYKSNKIGNFKYNYPINYTLTYSTKVPAISSFSLRLYYLNNGYPQQIDSENVKKGFYWKEMNSVEKKYLENLIIEQEKKQVK